MKNITFKNIILTILLALPLVGISQNVTLSTQAQINAFMRTSITGYLIIAGTTTNSITSLAGLRNLTSVGGYLHIFNNTSLSSLSGLDDITSVGGNLQITSNTALSSLSSLDGINRVGGNLYILSNFSLSSLSGLDGINRVGGYLSIDSNYNLSSLSGLDGLRSVGGYLTIYRNASLSSLSGLDGITSVRGDLRIINSNALNSLSGLDGLKSVGGYLTIFSNAALTSLSGLENITILGGSLSIGTNSIGYGGSSFSNPNLANLCGVRQLITNGEVTSSEYSVENNAYNPTYASIQDATTCNSSNVASVEGFIGKEESIIIYPNPAKDILHIKGEESITFVEIINTLGQVVLKTTESKDIHIGFLPSGVYFVKVTDGLKATLVKRLKN